LLLKSLGAHLVAYKAEKSGAADKKQSVADAGFGIHREFVQLIWRFHIYFFINFAQPAFPSVSIFKK